MATRSEEFLKTVVTDATLRQNLENAATPEARRHVIDAAGFADVSKEDIAAALKQQVRIEGNLSDAELEAVAGGDGNTTAYIAVSLESLAWSLEATSPDIVSATVAALL